MITLGKAMAALGGVGALFAIVAFAALTCVWTGAKIEELAGEGDE